MPASSASISDPSVVSPPDGGAFSERIGQLRGDAHAPLYVQLQQLVRSAIERRILQQDDAIPPERDLAVELLVRDGDVAIDLDPFKGCSRRFFELVD